MQSVKSNVLIACELIKDDIVSLAQMEVHHFINTMLTWGDEVICFFFFLFAL